MRFCRLWILLVLGLLLPGASGNIDEGFVLPDGLEATLWAESPMFFNPTNIDVDARGRIWVTEAVNYRDFNNKPELQHAGGDRVVILEDIDGDGRADTSKVFVQDSDLRSPLGLAVLGNRIFVSNSPNLIVFEDANGDDRADSKEVLLTGFGGFDHDHGLHAVVAGPDGRLYFNTGNAGPHIVTDRSGWTLRSGSLYVGGSPYNLENQGEMVSDDGRVWVGGLALRMNPDATGLEVLAHNFRNAYELAVDSFGNLWQNDNDDEVAACRTTWLMEGANAGYFSADGTRTWQADRRPGQDVFTAHWHQDDPGVLPAGDRTGAGAPTGIAVYESDALGTEYRGMILSADAGRNVVFGYRAVPDGAGYRLERFPFMSSISESTEGYVWNALDEDRRKWFRPSDVAVGPDGAVYVADWYDPIVGGHQMKDPRGYGRIYRIAPKGRMLRSPAIDIETRAGQIEALRSPAPNVRALGFEMLRSSGAVEEVASLLEDENSYRRARAVWLLAQMGEAGRVEHTLGDADPEVRVAAYRALRSTGSSMLRHAPHLARDPSAAVRREVALSLRDTPFSESKDILLELVRGYAPGDRWYLEALGQAASGKEAEVYELVLDELGTDAPGDSDRIFADLAWRLHPAASIEYLKARASAPGIPMAERKRAITALGFIGDERAARAMEELLASDEVAALASWWLEFRSTNDWKDYGIRAPRGISNEESNTHLADLRRRVLDTDLYIDRRMTAAWQLLLHAEGALQLVAMQVEGKLPYSIRGAVRPDLLRHPDLTVRALARKVFDHQPAASVLKPGYSDRGRELFLTNCSSCHRRGDFGGEVGPDLTTIAGKFDAGGLLEAIADPDASVAHGYIPTIVTTKDGGAAAGFVLADGESVALRLSDGRRVNFPRNDIEGRTVMPGSLMPDSAMLRLNEQEVWDIVQYLMEELR